MLLHSKIPANCIDRISICPNSIKFGEGPVNQVGMNHNQVLNGTPASMRGQCLDELTKNFFWKDYIGKPKEERTKEEQAHFTDLYKTPQVANDKTTEISWKNEGYKELAETSANYMLSVLRDCNEVYTDKYFDLIDCFVNFPNVQIYTNKNNQRVAYNPKNETEFAFGVSTDFSGIKDSTAYVIELKTGNPDSYKDTEVQVKIGCLAYAYYYTYIDEFVGMCYNPDATNEEDKVKVWKYTREDLKNFVPELQNILLKAFMSSQKIYLEADVDVKRNDWCKLCDCNRCPYGKSNLKDDAWQTKYNKYIDFFTNTKTMDGGF